MLSILYLLYDYMKCVYAKEKKSKQLICISFSLPYVVLKIILLLTYIVCQNDIVKINNFSFFDVCYENQFKYL
ncbi:uncharacterized protein BX663DRAFT_519003 [Cokeromyces recurvatus]|uniref:uncharacterized protein n=1 Tax=Cokeromyces recurvatus TaxID=90255 RepID=UPI002220AD56|nr:uncharacterized protein BX663DRAFT_519003 [Cokeromyces recurvatus]KAI7899929.1 hypothetical protein BX663DRAFT_519003 [Cokeromyces recurvatus]